MARNNKKTKHKTPSKLVSLNGHHDLTEYVNSQFENNKSKKIESNSYKLQRKYDETRAIWNTNNRIVNLFADSVKKDNELKGIYGIIFLIILIIQLVAMYGIFLFVGLGKLHYDTTTLNIFISGGLIETFALVRVVVVNLFNDNLVKSLNIILEGNNKTLTNKKKENINDKLIEKINNEVGISDNKN